MGTVDREKRRRQTRGRDVAPGAPGVAELEVRFEVAAVTDGRVERLEFAND